MSYWASKSVQPFGFCRYISSWKSRCLKLCLKKHGENLKIFFHFEVPQLRHPSTEWTRKVLGTTTFTSDHVCKISFRLLNIFEKICRGERIALDREEEKQKKTKTKKEVRIIFWRAMFGVNYLENRWREKFEIFWVRSRVSIFWHNEKWGSWLESFRSKKIAKDPNRAVIEADPICWTT